MRTQELWERLRHGVLSPAYFWAKLHWFLHHIGAVILKPLSQSMSPEERAMWFDAAFYHIMLMDKPRMQAYQAALQAVAGGRHVIDIGTGPSAILARLALQAGAIDAVGVEANPRSFRVAAELAKHRYPDVLRIRPGFSTELVPDPEAALPDLLVHEIIGCIGSDEGAPLVVDDAKRRLLAKDAVHVPSACTTLLSPVSPLPPPRLVDSLAARILRRTARAKKTGLYFTANFPAHNRIAAPQVFESFEFAKQMEFRQVREHTFHIESGTNADRDILFDGFVLWIRLAVDEQHVVDSMQQTTNWDPVYIKMLETPVALRHGDVIKVRTEIDVSTTLPHYAINATLPSGRAIEWRW